MPSLNFVLPHWLYWGTLLLFPLLAMYLVARQRRHGAPREPILFNAYLFWMTSGFMGLHRLYLQELVGLRLRAVLRRHPLLQRRGARQCATTSRAPSPSSSRRRPRQASRSRSMPRRRRPRSARRSPKAQAGCARTSAEYDAAVAQSRTTGRAARLGSRSSSWRCWSWTLSCSRRWCATHGAPTRPPPATAPTGAHGPTVPQQGTGEDPTMRMHTPLHRLDRVRSAPRPANTSPTGR